MEIFYNFFNETNFKHEYFNNILQYENKLAGAEDLH